jgi:proline iminopeptidase
MITSLFLIIGLTCSWSCQGGEKIPSEDEREAVMSGTILAEGFELSYSIEGSGLPCVVINEALAMKRSLSQELRNQFKFVFFDGRHNVPPDLSYDISTLSFDGMVEDVEHVRKKLGFDKIAVLGHSIWGLVALEYGRKYPEHTTHIIMNGTPPGLSGGLDEYMKITGEYFESQASAERKAAHQENVAARTDKVAAAPAGRGAIENYIMNSALYWYDPRYDASWLFEGVVWNEAVDNQVFMGLMPDYELLREEPITTPIFLSLGKFDFAAPAFLWDEYKDKFPNLTVEQFETSGHWAFLEEQELYTGKLVDWIKDH